MALSAQKQKTSLSGPQLIEAFLEELSNLVRRSPDHEVTGTPQEIVESVMLRTHRFSECGDDCIANLSRQLAMAVKSKGRPFHLRYEMLKNGRIKVAFS